MIRWLDQAEDDLMAIEEYITLETPIETAEKIWSSTERLNDHPDIGRRGWVKGSRELIVPRTPYIVVYRTASPNIDILRILHGSQRWGEDENG